MLTLKESLDNKQTKKEPKTNQKRITTNPLYKSLPGEHGQFGL